MNKPNFEEVYYENIAARWPGDGITRCYVAHTVDIEISRLKEENAQYREQIKNLIIEKSKFITG